MHSPIRILYKGKLEMMRSACCLMAGSRFCRLSVVSIAHSFYLTLLPFHIFECVEERVFCLCTPSYRLAVDKQFYDRRCAHYIYVFNRSFVIVPVAYDM